MGGYQHLEDTLRELPADQPFAVGLSGGADSLALLILCRKILPKRECYALIVDHDLQSGSAKVASHAAEQARKIGARPIVLKWEHGALKGNISDQARRARYGLMGDACRGFGIDHILLGHHLDDQIETLFMRKQAGYAAPIDGVMQPTSYAPVWPQLRGITLVRPLLNVPRKELRKIVHDAGIDFHDDPANRNPVYTRARVRQWLAQNPEHNRGLHAELMNADAKERSQSPLFNYVKSCLGGAFILPAEKLAEHGNSDALARMVACASGAEMSPPLTAASRALERLSEGACVLTLGGARLERTDKDEIYISRETGRWLKSSTAEQAGRVSTVFDGRYDILAQRGMKIAPLWPERTQLSDADIAKLKSIPAGRRALFGVYKSDTLMASPLSPSPDFQYRALPKGRLLQRPWSDWAA